MSGHRKGLTAKKFPGTTLNVLNADEGCKKVFPWEEIKLLEKRVEAYVFAYAVKVTAVDEFELACIEVQWGVSGLWDNNWDPLMKLPKWKVKCPKGYRAEQINMPFIPDSYIAYYFEGHNPDIHGQFSNPEVSKGQCVKQGDKKKITVRDKDKHCLDAAESSNVRDRNWSPSEHPSPVGHPSPAGNPTPADNPSLDVDPLDPDTYTTIVGTATDVHGNPVTVADFWVEHRQSPDTELLDDRLIDVAKTPTIDWGGWALDVALFSLCLYTFGGVDIIFTIFVLYHSMIGEGPHPGKGWP